MSTDPRDLAPSAEPEFRWCGKRYVAHVSAARNEFVAFEVCVFEIKDDGFKYVGFGSYGERFVSYDLTPSLRKAVEVALKKEIRGE